MHARPSLWNIIKGSGKNWLADQASSIGAARGHGWRGFVRARLVSFGFILALGFLLLPLVHGTGLVALMYRYLRATRLPWRQVLTGAAVG